MPTDLLRRTVAQLFMVGIPGPDARPGDPRLPDRASAGRRHPLPAQRPLGRRSSARLVADAPRRSAPASRRWSRIDHEGGRVHRLPRPFTHFPPAAVGRARRRPRGRGGRARRWAASWRAVGIDLDFAPVLDVWSNPRNRVIGDRAFGDRRPTSSPGSASPSRAASRGAASLAVRQALPRPRRQRRRLALRAAARRDARGARSRAVDLSPFVRAIARRHPGAHDGARRLPGARPAPAGDAVAAHLPRPPAPPARLPRRALQRRPRDAGRRRPAAAGARRRARRSRPAATCCSSASRSTPRVRAMQGVERAVARGTLDASGGGAVARAHPRLRRRVARLRARRGPAPRLAGACALARRLAASGAASCAVRPRICPPRRGPRRSRRACGPRAAATRMLPTLPRCTTRLGPAARKPVLHRDRFDEVRRLAEAAGRDAAMLVVVRPATQRPSACRICSATRRRRTENCAEHRRHARHRGHRQLARPEVVQIAAHARERLQHVGALVGE